MRLLLSLMITSALAPPCLGQSSPTDLARPEPDGLHPALLVVTSQINAGHLFETKATCLLPVDAFRLFEVEATCLRAIAFGQSTNAGPAFLGDAYDLLARIQTWQGRTAEARASARLAIQQFELAPDLPPHRVASTYALLAQICTGEAIQEAAPAMRLALARCDSSAPHDDTEMFDALRRVIFNLDRANRLEEAAEMGRQLLARYDTDARVDRTLVVDLLHLLCLMHSKIRDNERAFTFAERMLAELGRQPLPDENRMLDALDSLIVCGGRLNRDDAVLESVRRATAIRFRRLEADSEGRPPVPKTFRERLLFELRQAMAITARTGRYAESIDWARSYIDVHKAQHEIGDIGVHGAIWCIADLQEMLGQASAAGADYEALIAYRETRYGPASFSAAEAKMFYAEYLDSHGLPDEASNYRAQGRAILGGIEVPTLKSTIGADQQHRAGIATF